MENLIESLNKSSETITAAEGSLHFHNGYELIYVTDGRVRIQLDRNRYEVCAPSVVLLNPFEQHQIIWADAAYRRYILVLCPDLLDQQMHPRLTAMLKCRPAGFSHVLPLEEAVHLRVRQIFSDLMEEMETHEPYRETYLTNTVHNLLILLYRTTQSQETGIDERMAAVQKYIDEQYADIEHISKLADQFFLSSGHLSRSFKHYTGYSPAEYLIHTRLFHARRLLSATSLPVGDICSMVGYPDLNNFTRQFRRRFGIPPSDFRRESKGNRSAITGITCESCFHE